MAKPDLLKTAARSWQTTLAGVLTACGAAATALAAVLDGNEDTQPDWGTTMALITIAVGLFLARDSNKRSEDVGA